jgi:hypothetical protein
MILITMELNEHKSDIIYKHSIINFGYYTTKILWKTIEIKCSTIYANFK